MSLFVNFPVSPHGSLTAALWTYMPKKVLCVVSQGQTPICFLGLPETSGFRPFTESSDPRRGPRQSVKQAFAAHGMIVGRHDTLLDSVLSSLQDLRQQIHQLHSCLDTALPLSALSSRSVSNPTLVPSAPSPLPSKEPMVLTPEPYSGNLGQCGRFIFNYSLVSDLQPANYPSSKAKIAYMVKQKAASWAIALWEGGYPVMGSFNLFITELHRVFDHPLQGSEAEKRFPAVSQGSLSVAVPDTILWGHN